ncbi:methytransferase partner Trm112 [Methanolobus sp. ZRKC3]|uniref:methytransferase partner Trm112 n=1 Tax=Methanolobus sp. ZRKC3 TaxID=3125786 RepID=UPI00324B0C18
MVEKIEMKKDLMDILACPICKGDLVLNIEKEDANEVVSGTLYCSKCKEYYPIEDGIPNMLPPELRE